MLDALPWLLAALAPLRLALYDARRREWQGVRRDLAVGGVMSLFLVAHFLWGDGWIPYW